MSGWVEKGKRALPAEFSLVWYAKLDRAVRLHRFTFEGQKRIAWGDVGIWLFHGQVALCLHVMIFLSSYISHCQLIIAVITAMLCRKL